MHIFKFKRLIIINFVIILLVIGVVFFLWSREKSESVLKNNYNQKAFQQSAILWPNLQYLEAGVSATGSIAKVVTVSNPNNLGAGKGLDVSGNNGYCQSGSSALPAYTISDVEIQGGGLARISDVGLSDSDGDGFKESSLVTKNKLWITKEGNLVESASSTLSRSEYKCAFVAGGGIVLASFSGLSGADTYCQSSRGSFVSGTYKAWLSTSTTSASSSLAHSSIPYRNVNGTLIANNWNDLTDGSLQGFVNDVNGVTPGGARFTGTTISGASITPNCQEWTSSSGLDSGVAGAGSYDSTWTNNGASSCGTNPSYIYCFEQ